MKSKIYDIIELGEEYKEQNKTYITNTSYLNNKIHSIYESSGVKPYNNYKSVAGYLRRFTT